LSSRVGMPLYWGDLDLDQDHFYASQKNQAFYPATPHIGNPSPRFYAFGEKVDFVIQPPATPKLPFLPVAPKSPTTPNEPILPSAPKAPTTPGVPASAFLLMDLEIERDLGSVHAPEPATIVLIGGGVLGMVWRRKNRKYTNK
ncbi:MAG: PEP-CTERM sorting domain-containing protein, partial [Candidatus Omnitrophica bacterium]|nr:PEP-CTERM sorting domain-containing protein [Candidatus Omnitrophota bacterium]